MARYDANDLVFEIDGEITEDLIPKINKYAALENVRIDLVDSKHLNSEILSKIDKSVKFFVQGPLKAQKYNKSKYLERNTYSAREINAITKEIEDIVKGVKQEWNDMQKALYVYNLLSRKINYNMDYEKDLSADNQNLFPLISGKAVCAGYSSIFYELMNRIGIECDYVRGKAGKERHAWNVLTIDNKTFPVDLTWDACNRQTSNAKNLIFFGTDKEFSKDHVADEDEPTYDFDFLDRETVKNNLAIVSGEATSYSTVCRNDDSMFVISKVNSVGVDGFNVFKYVQAELDNKGQVLSTNVLYSENDIDKLDDYQADFFYNVVLAKNRIEKYKQSNNGYMGGIVEKDNSYGKAVNRHIEPLFKEQANSYVRENNSNVVISKTDNVVKINGINTYEASEFINTRNGIVLNHNKICTKEDLIANKSDKEKNFLANELLDSYRIEQAKDNGGYIGNTSSLFGRYKVSVDKAMQKKISDLNNNLEDMKKVA